MVNRATRLKRLPWGEATIFLCGLGFILQGASLLTVLQLGDPIWPSPWFLLAASDHGYFIIALSSLLVTLMVAFSGMLWWQGGFARIVSQWLWMGMGACFFITWFALAVFAGWVGLNAVPYPWELLLILQSTPSDAYGLHQLYLSLGGTYAVAFILWLAALYQRHNPDRHALGHAHFARSFELMRAKCFAKAGLVMGAFRGSLLTVGGFESMFVNSPQGTGKSLLAIVNLFVWQGSAIVNDIKGELFEFTAGYRAHGLHNAIYRFLFAEKHPNTARCNPYTYVSREPAYLIRDLQFMAELLIPKNNHDVMFWTVSSRDIFICLSLYLIETEKNPTLGMLHDLAKSENFIHWLQGETQKKAIQHPLFYQNAHSLLEIDERTQGNILKDFHAALSLYADPIIRHIVSGDTLDFRAMRREKMTIYFCAPDSEKERLSPLLTLYWAIFTKSLTRKPPTNEEPYPILGVLDEFGVMGRIPQLKDGIAFFRSYHIRCMFFVQNRGQIIETYGREAARNFFNLKIKAALGFNDLEDAEWFSKMMGHKTVKVQNHSYQTGHGEREGSHSKTWSQQPVPLMSPDRLMRLNKNIGIALIEGMSPIKFKKVKWYKNPRFKKCYLKLTESSLQEEGRE